MILSLYIILAAALMPILNLFFGIFEKPWSWWATPLMVFGFFTVFVLLHALFVVLFIQFTNVNKPVSNRKAKFFKKLLDISLSPVFKLARVHIHTTGLEKIPEDTRFLLVSNHIHDFDPAVIISQLPGLDIAFVGKKEIYTEMIFASKAMHLIRCLPIDRENDREAAKTIIKATKLIKDDITNVGIFPEGYTNTAAKGLLPFRNGAFKIAVKAKVPIVVCSLVNTRKIVKNMFRRKTDVYFDVLEVIDTERVCSQHTNELGEYISALMQNRLTEVEQLCSKK